MTFPPYPHLSSLRLATVADIKRMAGLSVLGFKDSEIFRFERPRYEEFPQDAVASFANIYRSQLLDPRGVVIVVEDWFRSDEVSHFSPREEDAPGKRVVVGVASWRLPEGSKRTGQFVVPNVGDPEPALNRDLSKRRLELFKRIEEAKEKQCFNGMSIFDKLVVHPSYRRRGHATSMVEWGQRLSDKDAVDQGVMPSHMGEPLYVSIGYEVIGENQIPDDGQVKGFSQRVLVYRAKR